MNGKKKKIWYNWRTQYNIPSFNSILPCYRILASKQERPKLDFLTLRTMQIKVRFYYITLLLLPHLNYFSAQNNSQLSCFRGKVARAKSQFNLKEKNLLTIQFSWKTDLSPSCSDATIYEFEKIAFKFITLVKMLLHLSFEILH